MTPTILWYILVRMKTLFCLRAYPTQVDAEIAKSTLASSRIRSTIMSDGVRSKSYVIMTQSIHLFVLQKDAKRAQEILSFSEDVMIPM